MVSVLELTISANGADDVPDDELVPVLELEPPRLPAVAAPPVLPPVLEELVELPLVLEELALDVEPAETVSPTERPAIEAIVPLVGA
ncbi:MAG TPA: hypothetical protein VG325_17125 [Solirubrobacteraceae bacterium]|jgi:hypothetical protein|nr:hypothetical protein [Solirubrobacteraceae bacterium]